MDLKGRSLKQYELLDKLGQGGMGVVYRARDTVLGREAAIKVLPPDRLQDHELRHRFHREARAASALNHPNVITIYEIGSAEGVDFIAMEYVSGGTLQSVLRRGRLSVTEAASYACQIADALAKAHAAGVVHRDIKPGNIMITGEGLVKVLDFGLARLNPSASRTTTEDAPTASMFTRTGMIMGTTAYMSPEQAAGKEAGPQSDIFSLGVVLFQMLSGELPFAGDSELARLHSLHFGQPKDLRLLCPGISEELAQIVSRMLEKDVTARYAAMAEVRRDLRSFGGMALSIQDSSAPTVTILAQPSTVNRPRSNPRLLIPAAAALVTLAAGAAVATRRDFSWFAKKTGEPAPAATILDTDTARPYDLYLKARGLLDRFDREENCERAIKLLERAVEKDNQFALGYATLTEAYRFRYKLAPDTQWLNLMTQCAERALKLNADLGASQTAMGLALMEQSGKSREAESYFRRAIDLDPRNAAPLIWTAALFSSERAYPRAAEVLQRALQIDPNNWVALQELGVIHYRNADYTRAAAFWEQARKISPDNLRVLPNLAAAYHMLGRYEDAASTLQRAIEIEPAARHYANLGTLRFFQGRYTDAVAPLEKAVELLPNRFRYWGNLADAYRWSPGHKKKAHDAYVRAIQLLREELSTKPDDLDLQSTLALYLAKSGDKETARSLLSQFHSVKPASAAVLFRLSVAYEVCGLRTESLAALAKSIKAGYAEKEIRGDPELIELRNDVRYHRLIATAGTVSR